MRQGNHIQYCIPRAARQSSSASLTSLSGVFQKASNVKSFPCQYIQVTCETLVTINEGSIRQLFIVTYRPLSTKLIADLLLLFGLCIKETNKPDSSVSHMDWEFFTISFSTQGFYNSFTVNFALLLYTVASLLDKPRRSMISAVVRGTEQKLTISLCLLDNDTFGVSECLS